MKQYHRLVAAIGLLIAVNFALLLVFNPNDPIGQGPFAMVTLGLHIGSIFVHPVIAAVWTGLGPGPFRWRVIFAPLWITSVNVVFFASFFMRRTGDIPVQFTVGIAACQFGIWFLLLIAMAGMAWGFGWRIVGIGTEQGGDAPADARLRFGTRDLLILMGCSAVVLGGGRFAFPFLKEQGAEIAIFVFLAGATIVTILPLTLAALMPRLSWLAVLVALAYIAAITRVEWSGLQQLQRPGPDLDDLIAINVASVVLGLAFAVVTRLNGYVISLGKR